jgi:hypothetical protein
MILLKNGKKNNATRTQKKDQEEAKEESQEEIERQEITSFHLSPARHRLRLAPGFSLPSA